MMFGYATDETEALMPLPIHLAHRLTQRLGRDAQERQARLAAPRRKGAGHGGVRRGRPAARHRHVVVSAQHSPDIATEQLRREILDRVIAPEMPEELFDRERCKLHINPTGRFVIGGPHGDAGLTGRKIIVDTYGGMGRHGGGAFSGKDATKVDRSGAYAARWAAKNVVAAGLAGAARSSSPTPSAWWSRSPSTSTHSAPARCRTRGSPRPCARFSTSVPVAIMDTLELRQPIYRATAAYGHFGRPAEERRVDGREVTFFPWERTDRAAELRTAAGA
jgi:S-adenosylmethionine synthetase